jgi:hypothetical protein
MRTVRGLLTEDREGRPEINATAATLNPLRCRAGREELRHGSRERYIFPRRDGVPLSHFLDLSEESIV